MYRTDGRSQPPVAQASNWMQSAEAPGADPESVPLVWEL